MNDNFYFEEVSWEEFEDIISLILMDEEVAKEWLDI